MKEANKKKRDEIKRMKVSFNNIFIVKKKNMDLNKCLNCKCNAGNNFIFVYKKNNELKGKLCTGCSKIKL